jgi:hypothetical protein
MTLKKTFEKGMTLLEITVVLLVLVALAGLLVPYVAGTGQMAMCRATDATLQAVKRAIMGGPDGPGFYGDLLGQYPRDKYFPEGYNLTYLWVRDNGLDDDGDGNNSSTNSILDPDEEWQPFNLKTAVGWRGPYLQNGRIPPAGLHGSFSSALNPNDNSTFSSKVHQSVTTTAQVMDAWNRPIVLQVPCEKSSASATSCTLKYDYARLVSAGPGSGIKPSDASIDTKIVYDGSNTTEVSDIRDAGGRKDDRVLYLKRPDPYASGNTPCDQL